MLGWLLAVAGCAPGALGMGTSQRASPSSVNLPPWTQLNGTALRASGPRSVEILVDEPAHFRAVSGPLDHPFDPYPIELSLKDAAPRVGKTLAKALSKRFELAIHGIRMSDDTPLPVPSDLSLYVGTMDWAIDCTGGQEPAGEGDRSVACEVIYRVAARLEDNRNNHIVAAGNCQTAVTRKLMSPDQDGSTKGNVSRIQGALVDAVDDCVDKLRHDPFGIYGAAQ